MKKRIIWCAAGLALLLLSGCAQNQGQMGYIGAETAKQKALEAASMSGQNVVFTSTDMSTRDGLDYYQVSFIAEGQSYQYDIDALTGMVISAQLPGSGAGQGTNSPQSSEDPVNSNLVTDADTFGPAPNGAQTSDPTGTMSPSTGHTPAPVTTSSPAVTDPIPTAPPAAVGSTAPNAYIGEEKAKSIALNHAGLSASQVTFVQARLEYDDGRWEYDVEFYTANYKEYDYEIDAYTGAVLSYDYDAEYYARPQQGGNVAITAEQARQLALSQVPGATNNDIWEFETDYDDGVLKYEGKIIYNGVEYEFEIDAYSGSFREWSSDRYHH